MNFIRLNFVSLVLLTIGHVSAVFFWSNDTTTGTRWAMNCKFPGNPFANKSSPGELCAVHCKQYTSCTHFEFTNDQNKPTCWLKTSQPPYNIDYEGEAIGDDHPDSACGYLHVSWNVPKKSPGQPVTDWAFHCYFFGKSFEKKPLREEGKCGPNCVSNPICTHFTWLPTNGGECLLYSSGASKGDALLHPHAICGIVERPLEDCTCLCEV